jgi:hypothetical protein
MGKSAGPACPPAVPGAVPTGTLYLGAADTPAIARLPAAWALIRHDSCQRWIAPRRDDMAEKKNRRASVQLNVRLEPAEAALIKRVIPKGSLRAVTVSLLVEHARKLEAQMPTITEGDATAA